MNTLSERLLPVTGIRNFRDYGGYAVPGGRLRKGWLFRSAQHRDATPEDLAAVGGLGFKAVFDLRSEGERQTAPCPRPEGFAARVVFGTEPVVGLAPHVEAARDVPTPERARKIMRSIYSGMVFRPQIIEVMRHYFEALATERGPTLIHCMAGKDRTGVAVALFHALVGVHHDDMIADYLLTNEADDVEARVAAGSEGIRNAFGDDVPVETLRVLMSVDAAYLEAAFAAITEQYGSLDAYMAGPLGVTPEQREQITNLLVV